LVLLKRGILVYVLHKFVNPSAAHVYKCVLGLK
jgi:hypothetical protein